MKRKAKQQPHPPAIMRKGGPMKDQKKETKKKGEPLPRSITKFLEF